MSTVTIQIRLHDGKKLQSEFASDQTLKDVSAFVMKNSDLSQGSFSLLTAYPKKEYGIDDFDKTKLESFGKRFVLTVMKNTQKGKMEQGTGSGGKVLHADSESEFHRLMEIFPTHLFVVDFFATWCPPCKLMSPILEDLAKKNTSVVFVKVDVDKALRLKVSAGIQAMPTVHFWKFGKRISNLEIKGFSKDFEHKMNEIIKQHGK